MSEATYTRWAAAQLNVTNLSVKRARSGDNSTVFEIAADDARWFLKIGDRLARECAGLRWLQGRLPVPEVVAFGRVEGVDALLMAAIPGTNLAALVKERPPGDIVEMLASALRFFHSASAEECPFEAYVPGDSLVHGDACLPNIIIGGDGSNGYIDLGDMGVGDAEVDLSAAVWSLQYKPRPGLRPRILKAYGRPDATDRDVERLRVMYATRPGPPSRLPATRGAAAGADAATKILETCFVMEDKHAMRVQNFRDNNNLQDLFGDMPDMSGMSCAVSGRRPAAGSRRRATRSHATVRYDHDFDLDLR